jgi:hypothetical protein
VSRTSDLRSFSDCSFADSSTANHLRWLIVRDCLFACLVQFAQTFIVAETVAALNGLYRKGQTNPFAFRLSRFHWSPEAVNDNIGVMKR